MEQAALRLKIFARAEAATSGDRIRETAALETLMRAETPAALTSETTAQWEVAVGLHMSPRTAPNHVGVACSIVRDLPLTLQRLRDGRISAYHALRLADLPVDHASAAVLSTCEAEVWQRADGKDLTAPELARLARRVMTRSDPTVFAAVHTAARRRMDVSMRAEEMTGMAWLSAYLPVLDAAGVMTAIQAHAATCKTAGDPRPIEELRVDALRVWAEDHLAAGTASDSTDDRRPRSHGRPVEVHVAVSLDSLQGLAEYPGEIPGFGPVPAQEIRQLARDAATRLLVHDATTGRLLDYGRTTYRAPADLAATVCATWATSAGPGATTAATRCDLDHHTEWDNGGHTNPDNLIPLDRHTHRARTQRAINYNHDPTTGHLTWTTRLGQQTTTEPFDYRLGP